MPMREQKPGGGEDGFTTRDRDSEGPGAESERSGADGRLGGRKGIASTKQNHLYEKQ